MRLRWRLAARYSGGLKPHWIVLPTFTDPLCEGILLSLLPPGSMLKAECSLNLMTKVYWEANLAGQPGPSGYSVASRFIVFLICTVYIIA